MSKNQNYHHGDLRNLLISESLDMLETQGLNSFSMRKLAERVGVSRTAPYHHFKDKSALLAAIAEQGFNKMSKQLADIVASFDLNANVHFERSISTYIDFALSNPMQYDLMYGQELWRNQPSATLQRTAKDCFRQYAKVIALFQQHGYLLKQDDSLRMAQVLWSTLHGLVKLAHDGIFVRKEDLYEMASYALAKYQNESIEK